VNTVRKNRDEKAKKIIFFSLSWIKGNKKNETKTNSVAVKIFEAKNGELK
jgi:hypothetical protein